MESAIEDHQSSASANTGRSPSKLLRYPLRSATKPKDEKTPVAESADSSVPNPKRGRPASSVSKSMGVLDISSKDKSAKPPRRLSIPAKSTAGPAPKPTGHITSISETRAKRSVSSRGRSDTPASDVSRSSNRRKFSVLSSASYWLSQIKLSESAAKHSISLGFFKLALEAGCEPLQRMRDELKSYTHRHNLAKLGDHAKELFESYNISENFEQFQVSETCSQVPEEGTQSSDDDVHSSSSSMGTKKLKPKSLNTDGGSPAKESRKETTRKSTHPVTRSKGLVNKNSVNPTSASQAGARKTQKKSQMPNKQESNKVDSNAKKQGKKSAQKEGLINTSPPENALEENKENVDDPHTEEMSSTEV